MQNTPPGFAEVANPAHPQGVGRELVALFGLLLLMLCLLTSCGVQRPLMQPKDIPAYEQDQRERRAQMEEEQRQLEQSIQPQPAPAPKGSN